MIDFEWNLYEEAKIIFCAHIIFIWINGECQLYRSEQNLLRLDGTNAIIQNKGRESLLLKVGTGLNTEYVIL